MGQWLGMFTALSEDLIWNPTATSYSFQLDYNFKEVNTHFWTPKEPVFTACIHTHTHTFQTK